VWLRGVGLVVGLGSRLPLRRRLRLRLSRWRNQWLLVHIDDGVVGPSGGFFGPHRRDPVDELSGALVLAIPFGVAAHGSAFALQRGPIAELGVEQDLQVRTQCRQLGAELRHLVRRLSPQFGSQLAA
jgi:hypothetical protein